MTSRGNQSVSPPAQIPQQRHVNTISSSTPPPQQYYPAQSSALSQGTYEFLPQAQSQPYISYQAYGSALSDTRGQTGNSGRGVPSQQSLPQAGNFYQQPGPNIRPQQSHQNHAYFLNVQSQRNIRHSRPPHQSTSQQMFIPQIFRPQNNVITIPANMQYQSARVPMFQPNPFVQNTSYPTNIVYYPNGAPAWTNPALAPAATPAIRPLVREKKVLSIQDPDTGRDITEELLNSRSHAASNEEHHEDTTPVNQTDKDIVCQTFTRLVADRLKSPDDSSTSVTSAESHGAVSGAPVTSGTVIASQQYQQPPPPQAQQQQPAPVATASMMHPPPAMPLHIIPPRSGVIQQPPSSSTPSHDMQHQVLNVNLSMPPPQFPVRQSTQAGYSNVPQQQQQQQHPTHHASRHAQPPQQQQPIRQQMPPTIHPTSQQTEVQTQSHHQPPQTPPNLPSSTIVESALLTSVSDIQKTQVEATSQDNIPAKPTGPNTPTIEPATEPSSPVKEVSFTPSQTAEVGAIPSSKLSSMKTLADSEEINIVDKPDDSGRVEASHGESSQVAKDGRKGKKSKKDFIRKEIGGSDMDAFIDSTQKPKSNPWKTSAVGSTSASPSCDRGDSETKIIAETTSTKNMLKRDPKNPWKIQPAPEMPTLKREIQNPLTLRGPDPAQTKLSVSTSSAQERSGEKPNPWKILPVKTLETNISNPSSDSEIVKNMVTVVLKPVSDADCNKAIAVSISDTTGDFSVISTMSNSENIASLTSTLKPNPISSNSLSTSISITLPKQENEIAVKNLECPSYSSQSIMTSTQSSVNENVEPIKSNTIQGHDLITLVTPKFSSDPWHRKLATSVISQASSNKEKPFILKRLKSCNLKNSDTPIYLNCSQDFQNKIASSVFSSVKNFKNSNVRTNANLQLNHKSLASSSEITCTSKPYTEAIPSILPTNSSSDPEDRLGNAKINIDRSYSLSRNPPFVDTVETANQMGNHHPFISAQQVQDEKSTVHKPLYSCVVTSQNEGRRKSLQDAKETIGKPTAQHLSQVPLTLL